MATTLSPDLEGDRCKRGEDDLFARGEDDLSARGEALGIRHFLVCYSGLNHDSRAVLVPRAAIGRAQREGCGSHPHNFHGVQSHLDGMVFIPDSKSLIQLPWKPEIGWVMRFVVFNT